VKETKDAYEVLADLPGMEKKDINISLHDNVLTVSGERKFEEKSEDENRYFQERTYGSFSRSFRLPYQVNQKDIRAEYKNGVLKVVLLKSEEAKPREIEIK
jgi:HSP20 family protein